MSAALYESVARIARHEVSRQAMAGLGVVTDAFPADATPADHAVTVKMLDTGMVLPRLPVAVGVMGFAAIPAVDDLVLVVFANGDYAAGIVAGRLYHPDQDPPKHSAGDIVLALPSASSDPGLKLLIKGDEPSIALELKGDVKLSITEGKVEITAGDMRLTLDNSGSGVAEVAAGGSTITIKKDGDITVSSSGKLKLEGTEVEISGSSKVKVSGAQVEIN